MHRWSWIFVLMLFSVSDVYGGSTIFRAKPAGTPQFSQGTIFNCGSPSVVDFEAGYSFNPIFIIGETDPNCPRRVGANPFRFTVGLYRDDTLLSQQRVTLHNCYFRTRFEGIPALPGNYRANFKFERRILPWLWKEVETVDTSVIAARDQDAVPDFTVNGQAGPTGGAPIHVNGTHPIIVDGSGTRCATDYFVGAQESDRWWNRTGFYEWGRWFTGSPPSDLNLQKLSTTYSYPPDYLGTDLTRQGAALVGGYLDPPANTRERYYRVGICTARPSWSCKTILIKVD